MFPKIRSKIAVRGKIATRTLRRVLLTGSVRENSFAGQQKKRTNRKKRKHISLPSFSVTVSCISKSLLSGSPLSSVPPHCSWTSTSGNDDGGYCSAHITAITLSLGWHNVLLNPISCRSVLGRFRWFAPPREASASCFVSDFCRQSVATRGIFVWVGG